MKELIPKDKFDISTAENLLNYSIDEIREIVPKLLEWLQDANWPVFGPVRDYLEKNTQLIQNEILEIFKTDDSTWKYWIILNLCDKVNDQRIIFEIKRLANNPTQSEKEEGLDEISKDLISEMNW